MEVHFFVLIILLSVLPYNYYNLVQGSNVELSQDEKIAMKRQLELINKPAIKSFVTQHGDVLDCVEIHKQFAFDNPLLKNHSIQMKPTFKIPKPRKSNDNSSSILTASQLLPKNMRCPKGTVLIRRIQAKDLMAEKLSSKSKIYETTISTSSNNYSKFGHPNDDIKTINEIATLVTSIPNTGASGKINIWKPEVCDEYQFSNAAFYVRNDDGSNSNAIVAGWTVNPIFYEDYTTRLYTYWTRDSGKSTGCIDTRCAGFVQTSKKVTLGQELSPTSKRLGHQYFIDLTIQQDVNTKNCFLLNKEEVIGYWPKELFTTLANGATKAGWGGEILRGKTTTSPTPAMGSGRFSKENFSDACLMKWLMLRAPQGFPNDKDLQYYMTRPQCYDIWHGTSPMMSDNNHDPNDDDDESSNWAQFIYFGGPPDCKYN